MQTEAGSVLMNELPQGADGLNLSVKILQGRFKVSTLGTANLNPSHFMKYFLSFLLTITFNIHYLFAQCNGGSPYAGGVNNISPTSVSMMIGCSSCPANVTVYLEYGPVGFTPGTAASPGPGGTVKVYNTSFITDTITGLSPGTQYHYYTRALCNGSFSANTTVASFATSPDCATAPVLTCNALQTYTLQPLQGAWNTCNSTQIYKIVIYILKIGRAHV